MAIKDMTITEAFSELIENWHDLPKKFRNKHKSVISKYNNGKIGISYEKKISMLSQIGYEMISEAKFKSPFEIKK